MKAGAADWFHNDLYEDEWQGGNQPVDGRQVWKDSMPAAPAFAAEVATKAE